jgi:predicted metal-dependent phosphoesterase TrpH
MIKIDLHTHSTASKDGGITLEQYKKILNTGILNAIAITDHDRIDFALKAREILGEKQIIVGQEVTTTDGDIIGLYLKNPITVGLSAKEAADEIHNQGGIVCIPHPFENLRKGINIQVLNDIVNSVDLIEVHNGRAVFQNFSSSAIAWAEENNKLSVANSDAHGFKGVGKTYTSIKKIPSGPEELVKLLSDAKFNTKYPPLITLAYPAKNKILKKFGVKK